MIFDRTRRVAEHAADAEAFNHLQFVPESGRARNFCRIYQLRHRLIATHAAEKYTVRQQEISMKDLFALPRSATRSGRAGVDALRK